jgi:hypothetical protein
MYGLLKKVSQNKIVEDKDTAKARQNSGKTIVDWQLLV